jgi:hypothetical protein
MPTSLQHRHHLKDNKISLLITDYFHILLIISFSSEIFILAKVLLIKHKRL